MDHSTTSDSHAWLLPLNRLASQTEQLASFEDFISPTILQLSFPISLSLKVISRFHSLRWALKGSHLEQQPGIVFLRREEPARPSRGKSPSSSHTQPVSGDH